MKHLIRFAVAGALMAGYANAQAQGLPSSGSSDLWLFVSNTATHTTFAEDTGIAISSGQTGMTAPWVPEADLSTAKSANFTVSATGALTSYLNAAASAGQTGALTWAVLGDQFQPAGPNDTSNYAVGANIAVFSTPTSAGADTKVENMTAGANLSNINSGIDQDLGNLVTHGYVAGGAVYSTDPAQFTGVWGTTTGFNAGSTDLYGQGPDQGGALNVSQSLYGLTGDGGPAFPESFKLGSLTLDNSGNLVAGDGGGTTPPVPLPAAVWLFGSGLLGLIGVGRRRAAAV